MISLLVSRATCTVTIRNLDDSQHSCSDIQPERSGGGASAESVIEYTCTSNGTSAMFTLAKRKPDNKVITILLYDGQEAALVDHMSDIIDGILVDEKGNQIQTLFINL